MSKNLRVLFVEDDERDVELLLIELALGDYDVTHERVDTPEALRAALEHSVWDVILSDYAMPTFDGPHALEIVKAQRVDIPFIIVSGTVDESIAVASMRAGAQDFIAKSNLARLLPAIARELEDASVRAKNTRMVEQLLVSERMASLGTLAAGVAHEINNPLAALLGNLEVAFDQLATALSDHAITRDADRFVATVAAAMPGIQDARDATIRIRDVAGDLKAFAWRERETPKPIDVRRILDSSLRLAQAELRHRARVVRDYKTVPLVAASETRLGQVFLNLIINAAHALPEGNAHLHEVRLSTRVERGSVVVEVHDTGAGIPDDVLPHIFDPFFTTKARGVGSGLGLAISHRCIAELGGEIAVETGPSCGTTFRITLPAAKEEAAAEPPAQMPRIVPSRRSIVIVDDDALVLCATRRLLAQHHTVWATTIPSEAIDHLRDGADCDVVLCDMHMPACSGINFYRQLETFLPDVARRVIFMSGGAFTTEAREFLETTRQPRIDKPFTAAALQRVIDELLSERARD